MTAWKATFQVTFKLLLEGHKSPSIEHIGVGFLDGSHLRKYYMKSLKKCTYQYYNVAIISNILVKLPLISIIKEDLKQ